MTEVHIIQEQNRHLYTDVMLDYFKKRYEVFVEERGWATLERDDKLEIDQYDTDKTTYLVLTDGAKVVAGSRFNPTTSPHMISEVFPHLVQRPLPCRSDVLEWSRYFVTRERRIGRTECRLLASIQRFGLEEGLTSFTGLQDMWWVPRWMQIGFEVVPLGLPELVNGEPTAAVEIKVSEKSLASVTRFAGLKSTRLTRLGLDEPPVLLDVA